MFVFCWMKMRCPNNFPPALASYLMFLLWRWSLLKLIHCILLFFYGKLGLLLKLLRFNSENKVLKTSINQVIRVLLKMMLMFVKMGRELGLNTLWRCSSLQEFEVNLKLLTFTRSAALCLLLLELREVTMVFLCLFRPSIFLGIILVSSSYQCFLCAQYCYSTVRLYKQLYFATLNLVCIAVSHEALVLFNM